MVSSRSDRLRQAWQSGKYSNRKRTPRWDCWTFAMDVFLRNNAESMNVFELIAEFYKEFHLHRTKRAMETRLLTLGLITPTNELTAAQIAKYLHVDNSTAIAWVKLGIIPGSQLCPGLPHSIWQVKPINLEQFIINRPEMYDWELMPKSRWKRLAELTFRRDPLYSLGEVALMFNTRPQNLREHIKLGLLEATPRVAQNGRVIKWFVKRSQLARFIQNSDSLLTTVSTPRSQPSSEDCVVELAAVV